MSRVTTWHSATSQCLRCLKGRPPPAEYGSFSLSTETVHLPLQVSKPEDIRAFYDGWRAVVKKSHLSAHRRHFCESFSGNVVRAYELVGQKRREGTVQDLCPALVRLEKALDSLMRQKDYDDEHPIPPSETKGLPEDSGDNPWLNIKLEYTKQCLLLLIHILWIALPDHGEEWEEWYSGLHMEEWPTLFIMDSLKSQMESTPKHPRRRDLVGSSGGN